MTEITIKIKDNEIKKLNFDKKIITIGRSQNSDIFLDNQAISRHHAQISIADNEIIVSDLGSKNGTYVNNQKIDVKTINDGDTITVGKFDLVYKKTSTKSVNVTEFDIEGTMIINRQDIEDKKDKKSEQGKEAPTELEHKGQSALLKGLKKTEDDKIVLGKKQIYFGKSYSVDVKIKGFFVASIQATIISSPEGYYIQDIGSSCKTKVNGKKVMKALLKPDDIIQIGQSKFQFIVS